jgi:hypothetical protein
VFTHVSARVMYFPVAFILCCTVYFLLPVADLCGLGQAAAAAVKKQLYLFPQWQKIISSLSWKVRTP